jgi:hypothetical protein
LFKFWEGYRSSDTESIKKKPGFQVRKALRISKGDSPCEVTVGLDVNQPHHYKIQSWNSKSMCKIVDQFGGLVAEVNILVYTFFSFSHLYRILSSIYIIIYID